MVRIHDLAWPDGLPLTPVVRLDRLHPGAGALVVKLEHTHASGSVKERTAAWMLGAARRDGRLHPGQPVLAVTSGNLGIALARRCQLGGHPFTAVVSAGTHPDTLRRIRELGGTLEIVAQVNGTPGRITGRDLLAASRHARRLPTDDTLELAQWTDNHAVAVHTHTTAVEIRQQVPNLDAFVAAVGSSGTFTGIARGLPDVRCVAVESASSPVLSGGGRGRSHVIRGTGFGVVPPHWDPGLADSVQTVTDAEVRHMMTRCERTEGIRAGPSAAAALVVARRLLDDPDVHTVMTLICDLEPDPTV